MTSPLAFLHTAGVVEARVTGSPELASTAMGNGEIPKIWLGIASIVIVWEVPVDTVNVRVTGVAAA
jgi:hypothetical protein